MSTKQRPQDYLQYQKVGRGFLITRNSAVIADTDYEHVAARIVACINACAGVDLSEVGAFAAVLIELSELKAEHEIMRAQVAELTAALRRADDLIGRTIFDCDPPVNFTAEAQDVIRGVLAKVRP